MSTAPLDALSRAADGQLVAVREALERAGYDDQALARTESVAPHMIDAVRAPLVRWALRQVGDGWAVCTRLFAYDDTVEPAELEAALGADAAAAMRALALIEGSDAIRARFRILPFRGLLVLSDRLDAEGDPVMGPGATTAHLANILDVAPGDTVLDVGAGAGTLALLAAKHGATATATDLDERAVEMCRINARLNDVACEVLRSDLTAAVRGRRFDRVLSQPPFVVAPAGGPRTTFLHGGARGDELALRLIAELPDVLAEGGRALLRVDFPVLPDEPLSVRLRAVLGDAPMSIAVLAARGPDADRAAIAYASLEDPTLGPRYADAVGRYRAALAAAGIERTTSALACLRCDPDDGPAWTAVTAVASLAPVSAAHLERIVAGMDVAACDDEALLGEKVQLAKDARLVHTTDLVGVHEEERIVFSRSPFADHAVSLAANVLLAVFSQPTAVSEAVREYADACEAEPREVQDQVLAFVRESLARGLLSSCRASRPG